LEDLQQPGNASNATEEYDGTSWTAGGNLNTGRVTLAGAGTQTAGLAAGGDPTGSGTAGNGASEVYNGTSWTIVGSMNIARRYLAGAGTQTAGLAFGGGPPASNSTEEYSEGNATRTFTAT
jgi:hypothetical protein